MVRDDGHRAILFDLDRSIQRLNARRRRSGDGQPRSACITTCCANGPTHDAVHRLQVGAAARGDRTG
jgi:hypothetical protein